MNDKTLVERLRERAELPSTFDFVGARVERLFDQENRHRSGAKPIDYLRSWLSMLRPFAFASKDDSWGEMEKLLCIIMRNYIEMSRESGLAATRIEALEAALRDAEKAERDRLRELAAGPAAWLGRWAKHVGDCQGGCVCSCGLTLAQMEAEQLIAALESQP